MSENTKIRHLIIALAIVTLGAIGAVSGEPDPDRVNPLLEMDDTAIGKQAGTTDQAWQSLFSDAELVLSTAYYGRARDANNTGRNGAANDANDIHVNALGQMVGIHSGYAWNSIGFDLAGQTNLGRGNGWSEVLLHREPGNQDRSSLSLTKAALKMKAGDGDWRWEGRGGFTPISIGSLGTSGGLFSHGYRGFENKFHYKNSWVGYGWADKFRNEWDNRYRTMTSSWDQNRFGGRGGVIPYAHSVGARVEFGETRSGFVDAGVGEGRRYRRNAQLAFGVPIATEIGQITLTGYGLAGRYTRGGLFNPGGGKNRTEYHISGSGQLDSGDWTMFAGLGHTRAPDSDEMNFRLTAWGNSDNRNFIQTWGQLDDFVWHGQTVLKTALRHDIGNRLGLPGLRAGVSHLYGWNAHNRWTGSTIRGWEIDYHIEYTAPEGRFQGLAMGVYAGHLRYQGNRFHGKQNRNDVKVIITYSRTIEHLLRAMSRR